MTPPEEPQLRAQAGHLPPMEALRLLDLVANPTSCEYGTDD